MELRFGDCNYIVVSCWLIVARWSSNCAHLNSLVLPGCADLFFIDGKKMENIVRITKIPNKLEGKTNWARLQNMTEDKINEAARLDKDVQPLRNKQLKKFRRVNDSI